MHTPCIEHPYKGNAQGYARVRVGGKHCLLHRAVYCAEHGIDLTAFPPTIVVRHTCDNTRCVNTAHLISGTQADNVRDMVERNRHVSLKGEAHGSAAYSDELINKVRSMYSQGACSMRMVAKSLGLSKSHVHNIITNANRSLREQAKP